MININVKYEGKERASLWNLIRGRHSIYALDITGSVTGSDGIDEKVAVEIKDSRGEYRLRALVPVMPQDTVSDEGVSIRLRDDEQLTIGTVPGVPFNIRWYGIPRDVVSYESSAYRRVEEHCRHVQERILAQQRELAQKYPDFFSGL